MFDTEDGNALQELAMNGAEPNAFTSNAITCYYFDSTEKFYENLEILLSFVSVPYFTDESVEKEQGIIGQEIGMIEDNPEWQVYKQLMQSLYHTSPARTPVAGSVESIREITAQTLYDCHKAFYTPANMCLVVVGDVEPQQVLDIARREPMRRSAWRCPCPRFWWASSARPSTGERSSTGLPPSGSWPATCSWASPARCTPCCTARG